MHGATHLYIICNVFELQKIAIVLQ
ncbi:hypothetical protein BN874_890007 [Candidatus Contendobacter odensis Run_B_J11]|uniref:Uncharacterized protein n=1 Tax=Candidatus Contendobacter odensis Run_B_J11 TaxID=1400861 RepID=A0A7U7GGJ6_9GAMM|nr:hypothetical protein BN874_890007 [Candidatus Contendobacter odensis Run_B_J11]